MSPTANAYVGVDGSDQQRAPLAGVRVADFSWVLAGPICARYLAAMGAEVIKIETTKRPDQTRSGAFDAEGRPLLNQSPNFNLNNYSKLSCTLDLTQPAAQELAREIVRKSDIALENFGFGVIDRFGLGYERLREVRPDIIMLSSSGMGRSGPDRTYAAYGQTLHAYAGLTGITGYEGGPPRGTGNTWADPLTAMTAAFAILGALHHRDRTGEGQLIDLSMAETIAGCMVEPLLDYQLNGRVWGPMGNRHAYYAPHGCYPCAGIDRWIAIAVAGDDEWRSLCSVLGADDLANDPRFATQAGRREEHRALDAVLAERTRTWQAADLMHVLQRAGVAAGPSFDAKDLVDDPHLAARGFFMALHHPESGERTVTRLPWRMEPPVAEVYRHAPLLGQHNDYVFKTLVGLSQAEFDRHVAAGIIR